MNKKTKEKLMTAAIIVAVAVAVVWLFFGGIVHIEDTNGPDDYCIDDLTGYVSLRIAGESAAFQFHISDHEYGQFQHND